MGSTLEFPCTDHKGLQAAQVCQDQRVLAQHKGEGETHAVEEWKQLNAQILLAGWLTATGFEAVHGVWLLSVDHKYFRLAPNASHKLLLIELNDAAGVKSLQVPLL